MPKSKKVTDKQKLTAENQIKQEMKSFDYDTIEWPIEVLVQKYLKGILDDKNKIFIPDYQREYVWDEKRKSKFIESLLMGIPIPYLFFADVEGRIEIVDGSQRIRTLVEFLCEGDFLDVDLLKQTNEKKLKEITGSALILKNLERLTQLEGFSFNDLPQSRQMRFINKSLKAILLSEKTDMKSRQDLFERINTGSDELKAMEVRKGVYSGKFYKFIKECAQNELFKKLCPISEKTAIREEAEERILRYFAYTNDFENYKGKVKVFIDDYIEKETPIFDTKKRILFKKRFNDMLLFIDKFFPYGFKKASNYKSTPRVRFEAISIGVSLALKEKEDLIPGSVLEWLESDEFKIHTRSDAANNTSKVTNRINYVKTKLLGS